MILRLSERFKGVSADPVTIATTAVQIANAVQDINKLFGGGAAAETARFEETMSKIEKQFPIKTTMSNSQLAAYIKGFDKEMKRLQAAISSGTSTGGQARIDARFYKAFEIQMSKALNLAADRGYEYQNGKFVKIGPGVMPTPSAPDTSVGPAPASGLNVAGFNIPSWLPLVAIGGVLLSRTKFLK